MNNKLITSLFFIILSTISTTTTAACSSQQLTLPIYDGFGFYQCSGTMPASNAGTLNVWSTVDVDGTNMTGAGCAYGNVAGAAGYQGTMVTLGANPSICKNYCTVIADCNAASRWSNVRYSW
jgi:hypothetical protein